jgi:hypothetical protein
VVEQIVTPRNFIVGFASVDNEFLGVTICSTTLSAMCYLYNITLLCCRLNGFRHSKHISKFWYRKHDFVLCRVSQKFVTIVLTFSLKIILRQFLSPFHKDYLTTNFNLTISKFNIVLLQIKQQWDWTKSYHNLWTVLSLQIIHI